MTTARPFIFISIPRVASTTIHAVIGGHAVKDLSRSQDRGLMDNHAPADMVLRRYGREEFDRRYKFCFVRNPWDRCVSWFFYHAKEPPYVQFKFPDWVKAGMPHHWDIQNGTVYQGRRTPLEQFRFVTDAAGNPLLDFIGKMEQFDQDMLVVAEALGVSIPPKLPRRNAAKMRESRDFHSYYDDKTAEQVGKILAADVSMFGYTF